VPIGRGAEILDIWLFENGGKQIVTQTVCFFEQFVRTTVIDGLKPHIHEEVRLYKPSGANHASWFRLPSSQPIDLPGYEPVGT
jgi:hypothetical protein